MRAEVGVRPGYGQAALAVHVEVPATLRCRQLGVDHVAHLRGLSSEPTVVDEDPQARRRLVGRQPTPLAAYIERTCQADRASAASKAVTAAQGSWSTGWP